MTSPNDPLELPCGLTLPNRIMKAAMSEALANSEHSPDGRLEQLYRTWGEGGYGLLITGNVMVDRTQLGEPGNVVINLTKGGGPGSLAHEWWHSADNYFGKEFGAGGFVTDGVKVDRLRDAMKSAFASVRTATQTPALRQRAAELDKRKGKPYWNTPLELSARAFESYVIAKLQDQSAANDYLANVVDEEAWNISEEARAKFVGKA